MDEVIIMNYYDKINEIIAEKYKNTNSSLEAEVAATIAIKQYLGSQYMYEQLEHYVKNAVLLASKLYDQDHIVRVRVI